MSDKNLSIEEQKTRILNGRNPYEALFMPTTGTPEQAKAQYFKLVKRYSPEREEETFRKIRKAYEDLRSPSRKATVDVMLFKGPVGHLEFTGVQVAVASQLKLNREIEHFTPLAKDSPESKQNLLLAYKQRAVLFAKHSMWNDALRDLDHIEEMEGATEDIRKNRIYILCQQAYELADKGLYADAAHRWRRGLRLDPNSSAILHNLAICATLLINKEEENKYWVDTLRSWHQEISIQADNEYLKHLIVETHKRFGGRFLNQTGDETLRTQMPKTGTPDASHPHIVADPVKESEVEKTETGPPGSPQALGLDAFRRRNWTGAITNFELHLKDHSHDESILDKLAWAHFHAEQLPRAYSIWQKMIQEGVGKDLARKSYIHAKIDLSRNYRQRRMVNPALVQLKDALKVITDSAQIYGELGDIYNDRQDWPNASYYYEKAIEFNPHDKHLRLALKNAKLKIRAMK